MKVGVDGVLLGAWANPKLDDQILDVGTGSGLISLMLAQKTSGDIVAIDIDEGACQQAAINFEASNWKDRLAVKHISMQDFALQTEQKFDFIISNPPFFINSLKADTLQRNTARHTDSLEHFELLEMAKSMLTTEGKIALILPCLEAETLIAGAPTLNLYISRKTFVKSKPGLNPHRLLLEFTPVPCETKHSELTIETGNRHEYTEEYRALTRNYYLKF